MWALILTGCAGEFGLSPEGPGLDAEDTSTDGRGAGRGSGQEADDDDLGAAEERVSVPLDGATWSMDLATVTFTAPPGIGSLVSLMDTTELLFHAIDESADRLTLVASMAGADGGQNPCERVVSLPSAQWDNPDFAIDEGILRLMVGGRPMDISDALLTATIATDGSTWSDGTLDGVIDARQVNEGLGDGWDVCALVEDMGGECEPCEDGVEQCFTLSVEDIRAREITTGFDPYVDDGAC